MASWISIEEAQASTGLPSALLQKIRRHGLIVETNAAGELQEAGLQRLLPSKTRKPGGKPSVASFFAGCGGLDLGLSKSGFQITYANDFDLDAATTYLKNFGHMDVRPIQDIKPDEIPSFDVLAGGFPCQPFSNAGSRKGISDPRGTLFWEALRFVDYHNPKVVIFENVKGILSIVNPDGSRLIEGIHREIERRGYRVSSALLNAAHYGVPQNRQRVFVIGLRRDISSTPFDFEHLEKAPGATIREALKGVNRIKLNAEHWELSPQAKMLANHIPEGGSWKSVPYDYLPDRLKRIQDNIERYRSPNFYRRFARHEVMGTVTAAATPENSGILHPVENRRYTVREVARFQTFPDDFIFAGRTIQSLYRQIGNAVPPTLASKVGESIRKFHLS